MEFSLPGNGAYDEAKREYSNSLLVATSCPKALIISNRLTKSVIKLRENPARSFFQDTLALISEGRCPSFLVQS